MSIPVTSAFTGKIRTSLVNSIVQKLTINNQDWSTHVVEFPTVHRDYAELSGATYSVDMENATMLFNGQLGAKTMLGKAGKLEFGFQTGATSQDLIQLFGGTLTSINYRGTRVSVTFDDKVAMLADRVIGSSDVPVTWTNTSVNPADLAWWVVTSYGGLSTVASISNPDIDYATWAAWQSALASDSVVVQAQFGGETVLDALKTIADLTDSIIYDEGDNKIDFARWTGAASYSSTITDSYIIGDLEATITTDAMVNRAVVQFGYNPSSDTWTGQVLAQILPSITNYGMFEALYDNSTVWYVNSLSAYKFAERKVFRSSQPNTVMKVTLPLWYLDVVVGDEVEFTTQVYSLQSYAYMVRGGDIDLTKKSMTLTLDEGFGRGAGALRGFTLDDTTWGLLNQTYNALY